LTHAASAATPARTPEHPGQRFRRARAAGRWRLDRV